MSFIYFEDIEDFQPQIKCYSIRYLTERECWRLQGFADEDFNNALSVHPGKPGKLNGALYKQAGNSMPVPILEAIFKQILSL